MHGKGLCLPLLCSPRVNNLLVFRCNPHVMVGNVARQVQTEIQGSQIIHPFWVSTGTVPLAALDLCYSNVTNMALTPARNRPGPAYGLGILPYSLRCLDPLSRVLLGPLRPPVR